VYDYIIEVQPSLCFRKKKTFIKAIQIILKNNKIDTLVSVEKINDNAHPDFVIKREGQIYKYKKSSSDFNRNKISPAYKVKPYIIITKYKKFIKYKKIISKKNEFYFELNSETEKFCDINNLEDLKYARYLIKNKCVRE